MYKKYIFQNDVLLYTIWMPAIQGLWTASGQAWNPETVERDTEMVRQKLPLKLPMVTKDLNINDIV